MQVGEHVTLIVAREIDDWAGIGYCGMNNKGFMS